jgi:hypothetical protein
MTIAFCGPVWRSATGYGKLDNRRPEVLIAVNIDTCFTLKIDAASLFRILVRNVLLPLDTLSKRIFRQARILLKQICLIDSATRFGLKQNFVFTHISIQHQIRYGHNDKKNKTSVPKTQRKFD